MHDHFVCLHRLQVEHLHFNIKVKNKTVMRIMQCFKFKALAKRCFIKHLKEIVAVSLNILNIVYVTSFKHLMKKDSNKKVRIEANKFVIKHLVTV